uniref:Uncharacterized protein n=1 Tax=Arion vulgaris TaxID=1028688 RepID=A0A0B6YZM3_9EUPU
MGSLQNSNKTSYVQNHTQIVKSISKWADKTKEIKQQKVETVCQSALQYNFI